MEVSTVAQNHRPKEPEAGTLVCLSPWEQEVIRELRTIHYGELRISKLNGHPDLMVKETKRKFGKPSV